MRRTTINLTEATDRQIEYLQELGYGSFSKIVRLAVDRMYRKEEREMAKSYLIKEERRQIKEECGIENVRTVRIRRDQHGYPDELLEGKDNSGVLWRGWLKEGESIHDITWDTENVDGWPEELQ